MNTVHRGEIFTLNGKKVVADGTYERYAWVRRSDGRRTPVKVESLLPYVSPDEKRAQRKRILAAIVTGLATFNPKTVRSILCRDLLCHEKTARGYLHAAGFEFAGRSKGWQKAQA